MKELIVSMFIPKNTPYCHHRFKNNKKYGRCAKSCIFWFRKNGIEYCKYLKQELSIQDQIKDCGINED